MKVILGIESSCDETAAAVVADGRRILSSVVASQFDTHGKYGGVVPQEPSPDGRQYRVLKDRDIMAVYDGDEQ